MFFFFGCLSLNEKNNLVALKTCPTGLRMVQPACRRAGAAGPSPCTQAAYCSLLGAGGWLALNQRTGRDCLGHCGWTPTLTGRVLLCVCFRRVWAASMPQACRVASQALEQTETGRKRLKSACMTQTNPWLSLQHEQDFAIIPYLPFHLPLSGSALGTGPAVQHQGTPELCLLEITYGFQRL